MFAQIVLQSFRFTPYFLTRLLSPRPPSLPSLPSQQARQVSSCPCSPDRSGAQCMPSSTEATLPGLLTSLAQELSRELRGRGCRVRLTAAKAEQLALDLALVHFGVRVACLIDAFLPTAASIEALSAVLERFFPNAPTAEGRSWILVQHVPSEQLYLVHPALVGELSADLVTARGGALDEASPVIWLDARSTVRAGTRLTRSPSHLTRSLDELLQHLDKGEELIYLEGPEGQQEEKTQRRRTLEGVSLAGLLLEYGGVYSLLEKG
ncbi:hypothetical protein BCV69DRAFT_106533 [Microstroma glucosiphilum]|uniref:Uncharacterized protein n=1 Tax=Pseudomicrostroma glucosiphilum TaxID=1684307 RepID=A0A316UF62_9BASI|nr:hypothetical protein BCV69DRAFT_106533 [Pseudomicrostroma glucosiphilum]PWN23051.1 hypothetical protein BCV69DRAFT_106533 [Pseudomicrostroma glucosiphilum]